MGEIKEVICKLCGGSCSRETMNDPIHWFFTCNNCGYYKFYHQLTNKYHNFNLYYNKLDCSKIYQTISEIKKHKPNLEKENTLFIICNDKDLKLAQDCQTLNKQNYKNIEYIIENSLNL